MKVDFRQGIITYGQTVGGTQTFLVYSSGSVSFNAASGPTTMTFAHGPNSNYLFSEKVSVPNAWPGPFELTQDYWLYWELDIRTGARTFGHTILAPIVQAAAPAHPAIGQMWFDARSNQQMWKEWNGSRWIEKIRVLAALLRMGEFYSVSSSAPKFHGTQAGLSTSVFSGSITYDNFGNPIKNGQGKFFTTEDVFTAGVPSGGHLKISPVILEAVAQSPINAYNVVQFYEFGKIIPAQPTSQDLVAYGLIEIDVVAGERALVIMEGVVSNPAWDFTTARVNSPVYVDNTGEVTTTRAIPSQVPIGIVVDVKTILLRGSRLLAIPVDNISHHGLIDLNLDDHPQYLTEARGDSRYYTQVQTDALLLTKSDVGHTHTHAALTGLDADDHPQYHDDVRGDIRYYPRADVDSLLLLKSDIGHTHEISDVNSLQSALDLKSDIGHVHSHSTLTGLDADDHPQYFDQTRGDARYAQVSHLHNHSSLIGLNADDHPQYHNDARGDVRYAPIVHTHSQYVQKTGDVMTGNLSLPRASTLINDLGNVSGNVDVDINLGEIVRLGLTGPTTLNILNAPATGYHGGVTIFMINGAAGVTWPTNTYWTDGVAPTLGTEYDVVLLTTLDGGTSWFGFIVGPNMIMV